MSNSSGISKERLAYLLALHREQQKPSPVNPGKTIAQDIEDSLKETEEDHVSIETSSPVVVRNVEESFQDKLKRLRSKLLTPARTEISGAIVQSLGNNEGTGGTLAGKSVPEMVGQILSPGTDPITWSFLPGTESHGYDGDLSDSGSQISSEQNNNGTVGTVSERTGELPSGISGQPSNFPTGTTTDKYGNEITYNSKHRAFFKDNGFNARRNWI